MRRRSNCRNPSGRLATCAVGPLPQRPLPRPPHDHPLLHQMLHDVHHEQGIAVRARRDQRGERGGHRPAQSPGHIRRHVLGGQELQPQLFPLPPPTQLLHHAAQRMRPEHHLHRTIRPQHQQPRRLAPLRQVGEGLDRRVIAPLQVFQDQHQHPVGRQHLQRLGELAQHPGRRQPVQAAWSRSSSVSLTRPGSCASHIGAYRRSTARTASRSGPCPSRPNASKKGRYGSPSP